MTKAELLAQHTEVALELSGLYRELASVKTAERRTKVSAFQQNTLNVKEREHVANFQALSSTSDVWRLEGEISALIELRDDIRWQLTHGNLSS